MDFDQCPCTGKTLGRPLQAAVLLTLASDSLHGYAIVQRLTQLAMYRDQPPDSTGVYRVLRQMAKDGLVESEWDLSESGPAKRVFRLTPRGRACLDQWIETLRDYRTAVADLLQVAERTVRSGSAQ